MLTLSNFK